MIIRMGFLFLISLWAILISACSDKQIIYRTKEVLVPVKCNYIMPEKPQYDINNFNSAKNITRYYLTIEEALLYCIGEK